MEAMIRSLKCKNVVFDDSDIEEEEDTGNDLGLALEKLNLGPRKKLLVLSLNGLIIHRAYRHDKANIPKNRVPDGRYRNHLVYKRTFSDEFMKFCFERFEVGLWSSAMEHNIDRVLDCAMEGHRTKLSFVWDQKQCTDSGFKSLEKRTKPLFFKELKKLWEKEDSELPWHRGHYSSSNTLLIDDRPYKALFNTPYTAIFPEPYDAEDDDDDALDPKGDLGRYLGGLADADDVPTYVKEHPFGQPAVTPSHSDWGYYSKIVRHFRK